MALIATAAIDRFRHRHAAARRSRTSAGRTHLFSAIADATLTIVDEKRRVVFAWFGGDHVRVFDADGDEVHRFKVRDTSDAAIRAAVERVRYSGKLDR